MECKLHHVLHLAFAYGVADRLALVTVLYHFAAVFFKPVYSLLTHADFIDYLRG
jgi:hypothetical protein